MSSVRHSLRNGVGNFNSNLMDKQRWMILVFILHPVFETEFFSRYNKKTSGYLTHQVLISVAENLGKTLNVLFFFYLQKLFFCLNVSTALRTAVRLIFCFLPFDSLTTLFCLDNNLSFFSFSMAAGCQKLR